MIAGSIDAAQPREMTSEHNAEVNQLSLTDYTILALGKHNNSDTVASWVVLACGPGAGLPLTDRAKTAVSEAKTVARPALAFGGGASCDYALGRQIVRTTNELWRDGALVIFDERYKYSRRDNIICKVWHLEGGGYMYAAREYPATIDRRQAPLTYAWFEYGPQERPEVVSCREVVICHAASERNLNMEFCRALCEIGLVLLLIFAGVYLGRKHQFVGFKEARKLTEEVKAIPEVDIRPTAEEAQKSIAEEVTALLSIILGFAFFSAVTLFAIAKLERPFEVWVSAMAGRVGAMVWRVAQGVAAISGRVIEPFNAVLATRRRRRADAAAAAAEAAAAELLADEPAPRDDARAGLRRRAPRGRRRERTRGATPSAKEPAPAVAVPESKTDAPVAPESKSEEPLAAPEAKGEEEEEPAAQPVPRGYENVARALAHLDEARLLPLFEARQIDDAALSTLEPSTLVELGVPPMVCLALSGAAATSGKAKKLEADDLLDGVAKHQSVLEEALREHRAELARLKISSASELPEDLCCPITTELMSDPVVCVGDGNTYERAAIEQWFATGARTSPTTNAKLESITLVLNLTVKRLIAAELERRGRTV